VELKHIKELMTAMGRTGIKRLLLKKESFELQLEREENGNFKNSDTVPDFSEDFSQRNESSRRADITLSRAGGELPTTLAASVGGSEKENSSALYVTSPMVGTFYSSSSPEDYPFVKVGDKIDKNTVVCIIEAMKVMNEIKAGVAGTITEVLVESGHPVEFGSKLFRIT
jgi:acetyl-CoA carboxylase biotin carboxyl carrier protein